MQEDTNKELEKIKGRLQIIERTRLICNTQKELGELVGYALTSGNGLARKGGDSLFMKDAIFRELAYVTKEKMNLDIELEEVLDVYEEVDELMEKYGSQIKGMEICKQLVKYFYGEGDVVDDVSLHKFVEKVKKKHIPVLILMQMEVLPRLKMKGGDVSSERISEYCKRVFAFLHDLEENIVILKRLPLLAKIEELVKEFLSDMVCRLDLIFIMTNVLKNYAMGASMNALNHYMRKYLQHQCFPDIEGFWQEYDSTVFWQIQRIQNAYRFTKYERKNHQLVCEYYDLQFFDSEDDEFIDSEDDEFFVAVKHPIWVEFLHKAEPCDYNSYLILMTCTLQKDRLPKNDSIKFFPLMNGGGWFNLRELHRPKSDKVAIFEDWLNKFELKNQFDNYEYDYSQGLAAITETHFYIEDSKGKYYKVPRSLNEMVEDVHWGDKVGILSFKGSTYIAFLDKDFYCDVTTEENRKQWGIVIEEVIKKDDSLIVRPWCAQKASENQD